MTHADQPRLYSLVRLDSSPNRVVKRAAAAARTEPTVSDPFDSIEDHVGSVYRYALRLTRRSDSAEELTQETLLRGWRERGALRDSRAARVWLLRIATNLWNDQIRRRPREPDRLLHDPICTRILPTVAVDHRENVRLAMAVMDELPPRQRQVLYLATCEGLAHCEVAAVLNISEAAVKANLSLARKEMRQRLKDLYEELCGRPKVNHEQ